MEETTPAPSSWEQCDGESARAFAAFTAYLDLGPERSLAKTSQTHTKAIPTLKEWSVKFGWVERARAYDAALAAAARRSAEAEHAAKIAAYRERSAKTGAATADVARGLLVAVGLRLKGLTDGSGPETVADIPLKSLPAFLRAAAGVAEISLRVEAEALGVRALEDMMNADEDEGAAEG